MDDKEKNEFELVDELIGELRAKGWLTVWDNIPSEMKITIKKDLNKIIDKHNQNKQR